MYNNADNEIFTIIVQTLQTFPVESMCYVGEKQS